MSALPLLSLLIYPIVWLIQRYRQTQRAITGTVDQCVACQSSDLTTLAVGIYRCNACGYEGGEGRAARTRALREASFLAMTPARRLEGARLDLLEARSLALGGLGDLERANNQIGDAMFHSEYDTPSQHHALASGTGRLLEARSKLRDAAAKLGIAQSDEGPSSPYRSSPSSTPVIASPQDRERLRTLLIKLIADDADHRQPSVREGKAMVSASSRALKLIQAI